MYIVGSYAMKHWFPDFREPNDLDFWVLLPREDKVKGIEYKDISQYPALAAFAENAVEDWVKLRPINGNTYREKVKVFTPEMLLTLKVSHSFWDIHWQKTINDIEYLLAQGVEFNKEWYKSLYKHWEKIHSKKRAYLAVENAKFFTKAVRRVYDHDSLHFAMAYGERPMFEKVKKDLNMALIDKSMFEALSLQEQYNLCREEIMVTAIERFLVPGIEVSPIVAYRKALKLLIVSMSKGFFSLFLVLNHATLKNPDRKFWQEFQEKKHLCRLEE